MKKPHLIIAVLLAVTLSGCANLKPANGPALAKDALAIVKRDGIKLATSLLINEAMTGFSGDWASTASEALYSQAPSLVTAGDIEKLLNDWVPPGKTSGANKALADTVAAAKPASSSQTQALATVLASAISTAVTNTK